MNNVRNNYQNRGSTGPGRWEQFGIIFYPLLFYQTISVVLLLIGKSLFGGETSAYMACQTFMAAANLPVMYLFFLRPDLQNYSVKYYADFEQQNRHGREILVSRTTKGIDAFRRIALVVLIALLLGTGLNNVILMSPLAASSAGYTQAAEEFYAGGMGIELLCSGILMPLLEEIVFRGVVYGRMRRFLGVGKAFVLSALVFGIMHFNLVQFVYAFFMGMVFVVLLESSGKLYCTIAAHMAVNILAVLRTETGLLATTVDGSLFAWITSLAFLILGTVIMKLYIRNLVRDIRQQIAWENANLQKNSRVKKQ